MSNPDWPLASEVAKEMGDESTANIKRVCAEMKRIREADKSVILAVACWRDWKKALNDAGLSTPRLLSVMKDNRLEKFIENFRDRIPAVFDSSSHDAFVLNNADVLREIGFQYRAGRLLPETLDSLGVNHE